jgi:hypothetical protein
MSQANEPLTIQAVVGRRLRSVRGDRKQEELARAMQDLGLDWDRSTVAALEIGRRALRLDELLLVCVAYETSLAALLEGEPTEMAMLGPRTVSVGVVHRIVAGTERSDAEEDIDRVLARVASRSIPSEADRHAARQLGVSVSRVVVSSEELWGRRLETERDRRLSGRQLEGRGFRGHVTRELLGELRDHIERDKKGRRAR